MSWVQRHRGARDLHGRPLDVTCADAEPLAVNDASAESVIDAPALSVIDPVAEMEMLLALLSEIPDWSSVATLPFMSVSVIACVVSLICTL